MSAHSLSLLIPRKKIEAAVSQLAEGLNKTYAEKDPLFIVVINGAYVFATDLLRQFKYPCSIAFLKVKSYQGTNRLELTADMQGVPDMSGRHVVILEDIVDSGETIAWLKKELANRQADSIFCVALLNKLVPHQADADAYGLDVEDLFVVGYGLDMDGRYRNLPEIYSLDI